MDKVEECNCCTESHEIMQKLTSRRNRTVKVTGFSLKPELRRKLHNLFSRVGQVDKVYLAPDRNSAFIRYGFKNALQFVLEQEWTLGSDTLTVRRAVPSQDDESSVRPTKPASSTVFSSDLSELGNLDSYRKTRNQFWVDVPHEQCTVVPSGKRKRKKCLDSCHQHQGCPSVLKPKRAKKKKKSKKQKKAFLESFSSVPFGLSYVLEECAKMQADLPAQDLTAARQIFIKGNTTITASLPWAATTSDLHHLVVEKTGIPGQLIHITVGGHTLSDKVVCDIALDSTVHYTVKGPGGADSSKDGASQEQKEAEELKGRGNKMYATKQYDVAIHLYSASLGYFPLTSTFNNRAQCYLLRSEWDKCISDCNEVLNKDPQNLKALLRRGTALKERGDLDSARKDLGVVLSKNSQHLAQQAKDLMEEIDKQQSTKSSETKEMESDKQTDGKTEFSPPPQLSKSARKRLRKKANCNVPETTDKVHGGPGLGGESAKANHTASAVQEGQAKDLMEEIDKQQSTKSSETKEMESDKQTDRKTEFSPPPQLSKSARKRLRKKANCNVPETTDKVHGGPGLGGESAKANHTASAVQEEVVQSSGQLLSSDQPSSLKDKTTGSTGTVTESPLQAVEPTIFPSSTCQEVKCWLQEICRLTGGTLDNFDGFSGKMLFAYKDDHEKLALHTDLPIGIARKVIFLRDNPNYMSAMVNWPVKGVTDFIESFVQGQNLDKLPEKVIDGPAFLSYKDESELKVEFNLKPRIAFQILVERDAYLEAERSTANFNKEHDEEKLADQESCMQMPPKETGTSAKIKVQPQEQTEEASLLLGKAEKNAAPATDMTLVLLKKEDPFAEYKLFLQDKLLLQPVCEDEKHFTFSECNLQVIFHKRKDLNILEKQFLFLLLCKPDTFKGGQGKNVYTKLWKIIKEKVFSVWSNLLPDLIHNQFTFERDCDRIEFNYSPVYFGEEAAKILPVGEFQNIHRLDHFSTPILLVDRQLLGKADARYCLSLKVGKSTEPFRFVFEEGIHYWLFDSEDFDWGFQQKCVEVSEVRSVQRCKFTDVCRSEDDSASHIEEQDSAGPSDQINSSGDILPDTADPKEVTDDIVEEEMVQDEEKEKCTEPDSLQEPLDFIPFRPFKASSWKYSVGLLRLVESGDNVLSRAVEFKFHGGCAAGSDLGKRAFLYKSLEFICGCLNARKNGTIYFGVAEKSIQDKIFKYGEISGVEMDQTICAQYYDEFYQMLPCCFPGLFEKIKLCVSGPHFVHVRNTTTTKVVIEIDIEPNFLQTKRLAFKFQPKPIFEKYSYPKKSEKNAEGKKQRHVYLKNQENWTGIFRRDGSETKYVDVQLQEQFESTIFPEVCAKREQEEKSTESTKIQLLSSPKAEILKRFMENCDASVFPILVLPKLSENEKSNLEYFSFLHYIRWSAIFDFDDDSEKNGVYSMARFSNLSFLVHEASVHDFGDMSVEDRKDCLSFPKKAVWLFTNGRTSGSKLFERCGRKDWKNSYWTYIQNAVAFYKDNSVIPPTRRLVLILVSEEMDDGIIEASQDIKTAFGWENVLFIFNCEFARERFVGEVSEDVYKHSVVMPWRHVYHVMCQCLNLRGHEKDKYVCTSTGAHVPIPHNEWQSWNDLEVLNVKECEEEWEGLSENKKISKAQEEELRFYQGKPVSWWNFFLTDHAYDHVMKRSCFDVLFHHIGTMSRFTDREDDRVPFVTISHMPAAGGTTLGKHILWTLKKYHKCAVIKKITVDTEREVTQFWESVEEQDKAELRPVILFADKLSNDSLQLTEFELCRRLYRRQKELQLSRPLAILIRCHSMVKPDGKFPLMHKLSPEERSWMKKKVEDFENLDVPLHEYFIALLSMRHEFDQDFLQKTIIQFLDESTLYENELKLIEYISLLTAYFPESKGLPGIPVTCCDGLMRKFHTDFTKDQPWEKTLSKIAKVLLVIESDYTTWYVRIANQPYARVILDTVLKRNNETLGEIVLRCLNVLISSNSPSSKQIEEIMSKVLIERQFYQGESDIDQMTVMSPLIMDIKSRDFETAVRVLQTGYKRLNNEVFNQQIARLYMLENQLDEARKYAELAVEFCPEKRDFKHTLGLVHLKRFSNLRTKLRQGKEGVEAENNGITSTELLKVAFLALTNFIGAQGEFDDDPLSICLAHCQTIEVVNKVLHFLFDLIRVEDRFKLGRYLTESNYLNLCLFKDLQDQERNTLKELLNHGIRVLRFLFFLSHSNDYGKVGDSYQDNRDRRTMKNVSNMCVRELNVLSKNIEKLKMQTWFTSQYENLPREDNALRFKNVHLKGCFFESIFYQLYQTKRPRKKTLEIFHEAQKNLEDISEQNYTDMDNLMTIRLAIQIAEKGTSTPFTGTAYRSQNYKMCDKIIRSGLDSHDVLLARAHLYRVLVSWPQEYWDGFNKDEFIRSFQVKSVPLMHRNEPLLPKVHFFVTKSPKTQSSFCHWTYVYCDVEKDSFKLRHEKLKSFTGDYVIRKKSNGEQSSRIDMHWKCPAGDLQLSIWKIRGEKVFRPEKVKFFLGFCLHGPVAFIHTVLPHDVPVDMD